MRDSNGVIACSLDRVKAAGSRWRALVGDSNGTLVPANNPIQFVVRNTGSCKHQLVSPSIPGFSIDVLHGQTCVDTFTFVNVGTFEVLSCDDDDAQHGLRGELVIETFL